MKKNILIIFALIAQLNLFAQFIQTPGISGGGTVNFVYKDGSTIWAGIQTDLYKTTDNGTSWTKVVVASNVNTFLCMTKSGTTLFVGSNNGNSRVNKSTDGGNTWTAAQTGLPNTAGYGTYVPTQMAVIRDTVFIGTTTAGVFKTVNYGTNWIATKQSGGCVNAVFAKGDTLVIGGAGIGRPKWSADKGKTMTDFATDQYSIYGQSFNDCISIAYKNGRLLLTPAYNLPNVYTDDWGATFITSSGSICHKSICVSGNKVYTTSIAANKTYVSTDNGATFSEEKINGISIGGSNLYFDGSNTWLGTPSSGIFSVASGSSTWMDKNNGLTFVNITKISNNGTTVFAVGSGKLYKTSDYGSTWTIPDQSTYVYVTVDASTIYACKDTGLNKSTDNGATWSPVTYFNGKSVSAFSSDGQFMLAAISATAGPELWMSTDGGTTWNKKIISAQNAYWALFKIVGFHKHTSNIWIAEMNNGNGFIITSDGGSTWTYKNPLNFGGYFASQGNRLLYQRDYEMYFSEDGGNNFRQIKTGLTGLIWPATGGLFVQNNTAYIYSTDGANIGLFSLASTDTVWRFIGKTNGMATYPKCAMLSVNGKIFAAPASSGVWKLDSSASSGIESVSAMSKNEISLYPNPANDEIHLSISNANPSKISSIKLVDLTGKFVKEEILNTSKIDISSLDKGIYFLNILFDDQTLVAKKIIKL